MYWIGIRIAIPERFMWKNYRLTLNCLFFKLKKFKFTI